MNKDFIKSVEIDVEGRLHLVTTNATFPMIYRTATEVHWNPERHSLYSPKPRDWSYEKWFDHILCVAEECNCKLVLSVNTKWINISTELLEQIKKKE